MIRLEENKRKLVYGGILAFLIPLTLFAIWYISMQFYPFSNKSILTSDLNQQYRAFFAYYQNMVYQKAHIPFLNWDLLSGMNMTGNVGYYLGSFWNIILLFFPKHIYAGTVALIAFKMSATGLATFIFIKKGYQLATTFSLALSTSLAFSGMAIGYYFNVIWLDVFIYLPLIMLGLLTLLKKDTFSLLYVLSLALLCIANFYMAYMVGFFMGLYFIVNIWNVAKGSRISIFIKFIWMNVCSVGLSAFIFLPTFLQLTKVSFNHDNFTIIWSDIFKVIAKLFNGVYYHASVLREEIYPFIYISLFSLLLLTLFFMMKTISWKLKLSYGIIFIFLIISLTYQPFGLVWQGFSKPTGFPYRFSFLLSFLILLIALEVLKQALINLKQIWISFGIISIVWSILSLYISAISPLLWLGNELLLFLLTVVLSLWIDSNKKTLLSTILLVIVLIDLSSNSILMIKKMENISSYPQYSSDESQESRYDPDMEEALQKDKAKAQPFDKYQSFYKYFTDDNLWYGFPSVGGFTSMVSADYVDMMGSLGYYHTRVTAKADNGTLLANNLLGVSRYIQRSYDFESKLPNTKKATQVGGVAIYEQPVSRSLGMQLISKEITPKWEDTQPQIVRLMNGNDNDIVKRVPVTIKNSLAMLDPKTKSYTLKPGFSEGALTYELPKQSKDQVIYVSFTTSEKVTYDLSSHKSIPTHLFWKRIPSNESKITLHWNNKEYISSSSVSVLSINAKKWDALQQKEAKYDMKIQEKTTNGFKGTVKKQPKRSLVLRIPYDKGWHYTWNGKKVAAKKVLGDLTEIELPASAEQKEGVLQGRFIPQGAIAGVIISSLFLLSLCGYIIWQRKRHKRQVDK